MLQPREKLKDVPENDPPKGRANGRDACDTVTLAEFNRLDYIVDGH